MKVHILIKNHHIQTNNNQAMYNFSNIHKKFKERSKYCQKRKVKYCQNTFLWKSHTLVHTQIVLRCDCKMEQNYN